MQNINQNLIYETNKQDYYHGIHFFLTLTYLQGQQEYRKASINISVPAVIENVKKTLRFETGITTTQQDEQKTSVMINLSLDDMQLNGNNFSGIKVNTFPVYEEIISFSGVFSEDQQKIETLSIDQHYVKYNLADRSKAHLEEKKTASFVFKDIPKHMSGYTYDKETTVISKAEWNNYRHLKYRAISETTISRMTAVNEEGITKWTQCINLRMRPTNYTADKPQRNKVAVVTAGCKTGGDEKARECGPILGIYALLNAKFSKVPGMVVLERENLDLIMQEQELSGSGLVEEGSAIESGKIIDEDVLVIIQLQEPAPDDPPESWHYKLLIKDKETDELVDPGISYRATQNDVGLDHFVMSAYAYVMKNYFM
ncbi:MAG: CsgG/HfaB family protein [Bacteroidota bacterium]|nr:CsgG/HfaB family protein [Bacteroidota bacterium]